MKKENNIAFIDGQNLHMGISEDGWVVDHAKLKTYLKDEYDVNHAYYYLGYLNENLNNLYTSLQEAGFVIVFREHNSEMKGKKKGNVDTDIVFDVMRWLLDKEGNFAGIVLVSGDGDYFKLVKYLIDKAKFCRILFPNGKKSSSLYNQIENKFKLSLGRVRGKIERHSQK